MGAVNRYTFTEHFCHILFSTYIFFVQKELLTSLPICCLSHLQYLCLIWQAKNLSNNLKCKVADPGCVSRIPDPDFYPSRIPDPKTATKEQGEKISCHIFFCSHKFNKIGNYFIFEMLKKTIWAQGSKRHRIPDPDPQHCSNGQAYNRTGIFNLWNVVLCHL